MKRKWQDLTEGRWVESRVDKLKAEALEAPNLGWTEYYGKGEIHIDKDVTTFIWWGFDRAGMGHATMLKILLTEEYIWDGNRTIPNPLSCVVTIEKQSQPKPLERGRLKQQIGRLDFVLGRLHLQFSKIVDQLLLGRLDFHGGGGPLDFWQDEVHLR